MSSRPNRDVAVGQVVVGVLMIGCAAFGRFPSPIPLLFEVGVLGVLNAVFSLMRTFGSALLGGVAAAAISLSTVPFSTCNSDRFGSVFSCAGDDPQWHFTGAVIAAGLCGAGLVLARIAVRTEETTRLSAHLLALEDELSALRRDLNR